MTVPVQPLIVRLVFNTKAPAHAKAPVPVNVAIVDALASRLAHAGDPERVTVPVPLLASKKTLSDVVGAATPGVPPDVLAQCVVVDASQVPVPLPATATQNFDDILKSF